MAPRTSRQKQSTASGSWTGRCLFNALLVGGGIGIGWFGRDVALAQLQLAQRRVPGGRVAAAALVSEGGGAIPAAAGGREPLPSSPQSSEPLQPPPRSPEAATPSAEAMGGLTRAGAGSAVVAAVRSQGLLPADPPSGYRLVALYAGNREHDVKTYSDLLHKGLQLEEAQKVEKHSKLDGFVVYKFQHAEPEPPGIEWKSYSQGAQDWMVQSLLGCKRGGFFIDLAANDYLINSNTVLLERDFDWKGLCIEGNPNYMWGLSQRRCGLVWAAVGTPENDEIEFMFAAEYGGLNKGEDGAHQVVAFSLASMTKILKAMAAPTTIDYMSLDVEDAELSVMQGFPFDHHKIMVLSVERPKLELQDLLRANSMHFLRMVGAGKGWGEEIWIHKDLPDFADLKKRFGHFTHNKLPASCLEKTPYDMEDIDIRLGDR